MKTRKMLLMLAAFAVFNFQFLNHLHAQVSFTGTTSFAAGSNPYSVCSADFNGDGKLDLAVANDGANNISVLLGNGAGSFSAATNLTVGSSPTSVVSADFNGDGKLDLAVANNVTNDVSILLGDGLGSFSIANNFAVGTSPYSVVSIDFNGDGKLDLATANRVDNNVSILLGDGLGSFGTVVNFPVGINPWTIISADFNSDGKPDLVVTNTGSSNISVLLGNGVGGFANTVNLPVGAYPFSVTSADFNADGKVDLAVSNSGGNNHISVLLGNGTGSFGAVTNFALNSAPLTIINADFNGDGKIDLAVGNNSSGDVSVLLGNGLGSFGTASNFIVDGNPYSITSADFNGDGNIDLATANFNSDNASVLLNNTLPPGAPICLITVDPTNTHNVIVWEKTNLNLAPIDSFLIFREITTNNYQQIGHVSKDSLSLLKDNVNPSSTGYRYKIKVKNTAGISSNFSVYHNTIYLTNTGGNFSWTPYQVENNTTPVASYNVYRDDNLSGTFNLIGNTTGNQFGYTDVNYSSFPNARYYVEAVMVAGACFPTRSGFGTARSNIKGFGITGIQQLDVGLIKIYPNPATSILNIEGITDKTTLHLYDVVGKLVMEKEVENNTTINTSELVEGIYTLLTETKGGRKFNKIVINH